MTYPHVLIVTDGAIIRTIYPPALSAADRASLVGIIERALVLREPQMLGERSLVRVAPKEIPNAKANLMTQGEIARESGYTGDPCEHCGAFKLKVSGHCFVCDSCGETTGCS